MRISLISCFEKDSPLAVTGQFIISYTDREDFAVCGGNSADKLRYTRSVAYSLELVLLNKHKILSVAEHICTDTFMAYSVSVADPGGRMRGMHPPHRRSGL